MLSHKVVGPLETRDDALQCAITSVSVRLAGIETRYCPSSRVVAVHDRKDSHCQCMLATFEGLHFGEKQLLDLFLGLWQPFHLNDHGIVSFGLSFLCLCRNRAIFPLSAFVFGKSPMELALSNSSLWSLLGMLFHCMITAAPRQRRTCSSSAANASPTCSALLESTSPYVPSWSSACAMFL